MKKLTPSKLESLDEARRIFFGVLEDIIVEVLPEKDRVSILEILGEISKKAIKSSTLAYAREIQQGTDTNLANGEKEEEENIS